MRRLILIFLVIVFAASACFGASGTWRCANGTPCVFTPGIGYHCPNSCPASRMVAMSATMPQMAVGGCPHCRQAGVTRAKATSSAGPCSMSCGGCKCRFEASVRRAPATMTHTPVIMASVVADHPAVSPTNHFTLLGFVTGPIIFTTGPPGLSPTDPTVSSPSRAPPRHLAA